MPLNKKQLELLEFYKMSFSELMPGVKGLILIIRQLEIELAEAIVEMSVYHSALLEIEQVIYSFEYPDDKVKHIKNILDKVLKGDDNNATE